MKRQRTRIHEPSKSKRLCPLHGVLNKTSQTLENLAFEAFQALGSMAKRQEAHFSLKRYHLYPLSTTFAA
jgi:hypothetical protein